MEASLIWRRLNILRRKIVTSQEIKELARELEKDENRTLYYLQEENYIIRILRGIFYVNSLQERNEGMDETTIYEKVAMALEVKGVRRWYFGLETALKMNNMTHEYFTVDYVFTNSYRTTKVIRIMNMRFKFFKKVERYFDRGIIQENGIRYSDPERTVLDLAYQRFVDSRDPGMYLAPVREYKERMDSDKVIEYLPLYSPLFQEKVRELL